jgi:Tfp pilus assembly protein PilF
LKIDPDYTEAYNNFGIALAQAGRLDEAIVQFQEALRRNPHNSDTIKNLEKAQAMLHQAPGAR